MPRIGTAPLSPDHITNSRSPLLILMGSSRSPTRTGRTSRASRTANTRPTHHALPSTNPVKDTVRPSIANAMISARLASDEWNRSIGVGGGQRDTQQQPGPPVESEHQVRQHRHPHRGDHGADHTDPQHRAAGGAESAPADVHTTVEQQQDQHHGDHPLHRENGHPPQHRHKVRSDRGGYQEDRRSRYPDPFADPVGQHRQQPNHADDRDDHTEGDDIVHPGLPHHRATGSKAADTTTS